MMKYYCPNFTVGQGQRERAKDRERAFLVAQMVKRLPAMRETQVWSLGWEDPLEKEMATHSSTLAWKIPRMKEPGSYSPWGSKELDTTERLHFLRSKNWSRLSPISYSLLPGLEKYCVNLDSLKYLKMVVLSLSHLIFSKITVFVPYITVFRIPGRLFIYLPELFTCDPWNWGATENVHLLKIQRSSWKRVAIKVPRHRYRKEEMEECQHLKAKTQLVLSTGEPQTISEEISSVQFSCSVMSDSLRPNGLQHIRLPSPLPIPEACSNSCPWSQWCHPTISPSVVPSEGMGGAFFTPHPQPPPCSISSVV